MKHRISVLSAGAFLAAVAIAAGAFGAHGLAERLEPEALELWRTACQYLLYSAFGLTVLGLLPAQRRSVASAVVLGGGGLLFAGTVAALAAACALSLLPLRR